MRTLTPPALRLVGDKGIEPFASRTRIERSTDELIPVKIHRLYDLYKLLAICIEYNNHVLG